MRPHHRYGYSVVPLLAVVHVGRWLTEQYVTSSSWFATFIQGLPMIWLWVIGLSFSAGLLWADLSNPRSWLRRWYRDFAAIAEVRSYGFQERLAPKRIVFFLEVHGLQDISDAKIMVRAHTVQDGMPANVSVLHERTADLAKGKHVGIMFIREMLEQAQAGFNGTYLNLPDNSINLVEVTVRKGLRVYRERIIVGIPDFNSPTARYGQAVPETQLQIA